MRYHQLILTIILIVLYKIECYSQTLIANGSFEDANTCTEADAECAPEAWMTTSPFLPLYGGKSNRSIAFEIFNTSVPNTRKYIQTKLLCPLIKDKRYRLSLRLLPGNAQVESIGALLSDSIFFYNRDVLINLKPSLDFGGQMEKIPKKKRNDWNQFTHDFIANGFERYLVIGSFQSDVEQKRTFLDKPSGFRNYYYAIDDVVLIPIDSIDLCPDYQIIKEKLYSLNDRHPLKRYNLFGDEPIHQPIDIETKPIIDTFRLSNVLFEYDSYVINSNGKQHLDSLIKTINQENIAFIKIHGHTDSIGGKEYNLRLSSTRAKAISDYLSSRIISELITEIRGFGDVYPIDSNTTENGRQKNRRVDIIIKYKTINR